MKTSSRKRKTSAAIDTITQPNKEYFWLSATSTVRDGRPNFKNEAEMEKLARKYGGFNTGSGTDLVTGRRDHSFIFPTKRAVVNFMRDAVKHRYLRTAVDCTQYQLDWCPRLSYNEVHYSALLSKRVPHV